MIPDEDCVWDPRVKDAAQNMFAKNDIPKNYGRSQREILDWYKRFKGNEVYAFYPGTTGGLD